MGISLLIISQVSHGGKGHLKLSSHFAVFNFLQSTEQKRSFIDEDIFSSGFRLVKRMEKHSRDGNGNILSITAYDRKGNKVSELKKIVLVDD